MRRVLVTGGAGTIGAAVVRRLLGDPDYEVRVSDQRAAPDWMREGCEVHRGDLRVLDEARKAFARLHARRSTSPRSSAGRELDNPHTLTEVNNALSNAVFRAALDEDVARFVYVSSSTVYERADEFPTAEDYLRTARRRARPTASRSSPARSTAAPRTPSTACRYTICRPFNAYGPGESPRTSRDRA